MASHHDQLVHGLSKREPPNAANKPSSTPGRHSSGQNRRPVLPQDDTRHDTTTRHADATSSNPPSRLPHHPEIRQSYCAKPGREAARRIHPTSAHWGACCPRAPPPLALGNPSLHRLPRSFFCHKLVELIGVFRLGFYAHRAMGSKFHTVSEGGGRYIGHHNGDRIHSTYEQCLNKLILASYLVQYR